MILIRIYSQSHYSSVFSDDEPQIINKQCNLVSLFTCVKFQESSSTYLITGRYEYVSICFQWTLHQYFAYVNKQIQSGCLINWLVCLITEGVVVSLSPALARVKVVKRGGFRNPARNTDHIGSTINQLDQSQTLFIYLLEPENAMPDNVAFFIICCALKNAQEATIRMLTTA